MNPKPPSERAVQTLVVKAYQMVGCKVYNLAQGYRPGGPRHGSTRQTKGLADLYVVPPVAQNRVIKSLVDGVLATRLELPWWHEVKRAGGKQSPEQVAFQQINEAAGIHVVVGGLEDALAELERRGLWRRVQGSTSRSTP